MIATLLGRTDAHHSAARRPGRSRAALIDEKEPDL